MFRTALRNVLAHKARLLMTVLAVLLGVAFVSGTLVFTSTISEAFQKSSEKGYQNVDVSVRPGSGDLPPAAALAQSPNPSQNKKAALTERTLDRARHLNGTASAIGIVSGETALADKHGDPVGEGWQTVGGNYFADRDNGGHDPRYPMVHGRAPEKSGEVALDSQTAARTGYKVGDTARTSVKGPVRKERITGVFHTDDGNVSAGGSLVLYDTHTAQRLFGEPGQYGEIYLKAASGTSQAALKSEAHKAGVVPPGGSSVTGQKLADDQSTSIEEGMSGMRSMLLVFAGIALFVGVFLIANTFTMLVAQRTRELALMRAVGASRRQVTRSVLLEALVVGAVAAVAGLAAGIGIGAGIRSLMGTFGEQVPDGPLVVSADAVVVSLLTGVLVTVLAAWLPARRAAKIPPVAAMNSVHATASVRSLVLRNTLGALLTAAGAALVLYASGLKNADEGKLPMGAGGALLLLGVFVLTPLLSRPLIAASTPVMRLFGVAGKLARQNSVRNPRRTAATASALMIGLTLITGMTVVASSVQQALSAMASSSLQADYVVDTHSGISLPPQVERQLDRDDKVTHLSPVHSSVIRVGRSSESISGVDGDTMPELSKLDFRSGGWSGLADHRAVIDSKIAELHHWHVGTRLPVTYEDHQKGRLTVSGIYKGNDLLNGVMTDTSVLDRHLSEVNVSQVLVKTDGGATSAAKSSLEKAMGDNPAIAVKDKQDVTDSVAQVFSLMLNMLYGLLGMAVLVAVLGVVNTLAMSVFERAQEIGMLRAIGLNRRGVKRMVRLESLIISLFGGVLGIGLGVFLGWAAGKLIKASMPEFSLVLPWGRMGLFLAMAAVVGILAALWPARRAARLNMLASIKTE